MPRLAKLTLAIITGNDADNYGVRHSRGLSLKKMRTLTTRIALLAISALTTLALLPMAASAGNFYRGFDSPSQNIGCYISNVSGPWGVRCDIAKRFWTPPSRPSWCPIDFGDYGQGLNLALTGKPTWVCAGDTALFAGPVLPYGHSITAGLLRCTSLTAGMRCVSLRSHHGFLLSKQAAQRF